MILGFDKTPGITDTAKVQSLMESVQLALNEVHDNIGGLRTSLTDGIKRVVSDMTDYIDTQIGTKPSLSDCLDAFYPVGSYYETSDTTFDPNVSFGGTWSLESEGLVHIGAGSNYAAGSTGGSKDAVLISHNHYPNNGDEFGFITYEAGKGTGRSKVALSSDSSARYAYLGGVGATSADTSGLNYTNTTNTAGVSGTGKNMQPYVAVNRWHRTA